MNTNIKRWGAGVAVCIGISLLLRPIIADNEVQINKEVAGQNYATTDGQHHRAELTRGGAASAKASEGTEQVRDAEAASGNVLVYITGAVESPGLYELTGAPSVGDVIKSCGGLLPYAAADTLNMAEKVEDGTHIHVPFAFTGNPEVLLRRQKININTAGEKELTTLNGIGPAMAKRILEYRGEHGSFGTIDELKKVKGIGNGIFNKCKDKITV